MSGRAHVVERDPRERGREVVAPRAEALVPSVPQDPLPRPASVTPAAGPVAPAAVVPELTTGGTPAGRAGGDAAAPIVSDPLSSGPLARRAFFRAVMGDALQAATAAANTSGPLRSALGDAAALASAAGIGFNDLVVLDRPHDVEAGGAGDSSSASPAAYRSPYRIEANELMVLDQRRFPGAIINVPCLSAQQAAAAIRDGLAQGPGTIAAVGAYGLVRGARARAAAPPDPSGPAAAPEPGAAEGRPGAQAPWLAPLYADANEIVAAAPGIVPLRRMIDRLVARAGEAAASGTPDWEAAEMLASEAGAAGMEELLDLSAIVLAGTELLQAERRRLVGTAAEPRPRTQTAEPAPPAGAPERVLRVLVHGPVGALGFGTLGPVAGTLQGAVAAGLSVHVFVAEGRPSQSGVRFAWELTAAGIGHGLVPDAAAAGLLAGGVVDVVLLGAFGVTQAGAVVDVPGAYGIAAVAARHGVPVYVFAPRATLFAPADVTPSAWSDVTPPELVSAFVTGLGLVTPPFEVALERLRREQPRRPEVRP